MEKGNINNPTGNAIIYWKIKGNNKLFKGTEIIASNFIISPLLYNSETLMINLPPVLIENYDKLLKIAERNNIDLIKGDDIIIPDNPLDFTSFYKKHIKKYNTIIQEYLIAYKEKNILDSNNMTLPQLINTAGELMESVRNLVKNKDKGDLINRKLEKLKDIEEYLNKEMKGFDLNRIIHIIKNPDVAIDKLVDLYKRKFLAIFLEDYEEAYILKKEINKIEEKLH